MSPLLDTSKPTYDSSAQPFVGYGLTYEVDDIVRIAEWLSLDNGVLDGRPMLDSEMLDATLQRRANDRGVEAGSADLRYDNGFRAYNAGPSFNCNGPVWVPSCRVSVVSQLRRFRTA